jgi:hypothetical protein
MILTDAFYCGQKELTTNDVTMPEPRLDLCVSSRTYAMTLSALFVAPFCGARVTMAENHRGTSGYCEVAAAPTP